MKYLNTIGWLLAAGVLAGDSPALAQGGAPQAAPLAESPPPAAALPDTLPAALPEAPPRPHPPANAPENLAIPAIGGDGVRHTVLVDEGEALKLWGLRSAFNVAALDCVGPQYALIGRAYRAFLGNHAEALAAANRAVDAEFLRRSGKGYQQARETFLTQLYNYFAYPATLQRFCGEALEMSQDSGFVVNEDLPDFSNRHLAHFMAAYEAFYREYERYRSDLAAWDAHYGPAASHAAQGGPPVALGAGGAGAGPAGGAAIAAAAPAAGPPVAGAH